MNRKKETATALVSNDFKDLPLKHSKPTAGEDAFKRIRELIVTGSLQPGQSINEQELVRHLGIGRTPVREALQRLSDQHVVEVYPRRGVAVSKLGLDDLQAVFEARETVEGKLAELAAIRRSHDEAQEMVALGQRIKSVADVTDYTVFLQVDQKLHHLIATAARNRFLSDSVDHLLMLSEWIWHQHFRLRGSRPEEYFTHDPVIYAIIDQDAARAGMAMREHVQHSRNIVRAAV